MAWFLGRKRHQAPMSEPVTLDKPEGRVEAEQAVRDSVQRASVVTRQRRAVLKVAKSLAEHRNTHFAEER